jgi:hypothetical protein
MLALLPTDPEHQAGPDRAGSATVDLMALPWGENAIRI